MTSLELLHNRIDLTNIPFTDRGTRLMLFRRDDALYIRMAERWVRMEEETGHYRQRRPMIDNFIVTDADDQPLSFTTDTYPHRCTLETAVGRFVWLFQDTETLVIRLPGGSYGISFDCHGERAESDRRGGTLKGFRNLAYTTNAHLLANTITQEDERRFKITMKLEAHEGDVLLLNITPRLGYNRSIQDINTVMAQVEASWRDWLDAAPVVAELYRRQYAYAWWVMRVGLMSTRFYFTREALTPSKIHYVGVWQWDQFFHALAYRHVDTKLAEDQLRIFIDHQQPNGMIPDAVHDEGLITHLQKPVDADVTKPPLIAWTVLKLYELSGRLDLLQEMYEPLVRWHGWWVMENRSAEGLYEYHHPFSSGLDDSPLWDYGMPVTAPDLNTYLYIQNISLAQISEIIGEMEAAENFRMQAAALAQQMLELMWNPERGVFEALHDGKPIPVFTPFHLMPMWIDTLPTDITAQLVAHLSNPETFWSRYPLPTVALNDKHFDPMQMWRGPTWVNINYLFIEALTRIGQHELATALRRKTLDLLMQHDDIYEYYHPQTAERPPKAAPIFGWSSAVFIDLAIQETNALAAAP